MLAIFTLTKTINANFLFQHQDRQYKFIQVCCLLDILFFIYIQLMNSFKNYKSFLFLLAVILVTCAECQDSQPSIHDSLYGISLKGKWRSTNIKRYIFGVQKNLSQNQSTIGKDSFLSFFDSTQGNVEVLITETSQSPKRPYVYLQILNKNYISQKVIQISFPLDRGYNKTLNQWKTPKILTIANLYNNFQHVISYDIKINFQMKRNIENKIQITLISDSLAIDVFVQPTVYSIYYFVGIGLINIFQIVLLVRFGKDQNILANTSQWLLVQACFYLALQSIFFFRIALGYYDTKLSFLFFNFVLNILIMMLVLWKFTAVVEKFKKRNQLLLMLFFGIAYFYLAFSYYTFGLFWIIQSMIFLWQISYSINRGGVGGVSVQLVIVIILSRIPMLSIMASQGNILKLEPDLVALKFIIICLAIHLSLIALQKYKGARFFTPVFLIPNYYNYERKTTYASQIASKECSICLKTLREEPNSDTLSPSQLAKHINEKGSQVIKYVETKCAHPHLFHTQCLTSWLNVHLICPVCRTTLPPMNVGQI